LLQEEDTFDIFDNQETRLSRIQELIELILEFPASTGLLKKKVVNLKKRINRVVQSITSSKFWITTRPFPHQKNTGKKGKRGRFNMASRRDKDSAAIRRGKDRSRLFAAQITDGGVALASPLICLFVHC
jgi:hypothetical protein